MNDACPENDDAFDPAAARRTFEDRLISHLPVLRARAFRFERVQSEADELLQDTVERALRNSGRHQAGTNLRAWLLKIMDNLFYDRYRSRNRRSFLPEESIVAATPPPDDELASEPAPFWEGCSLGEARQLAAQLSPALRAAVDLVLFERLSYREASRRLEIPLSTVGTRVLRGRLALRARLERARQV